MAALAESGLRNLNMKGNPFAGFFSMHRSLSKGAYRGFPRNPELQLLWFLDTAVIVRQREIAEGAEEYGTACGRLRHLDRRRGAPSAREPRRLPALPGRRRRAADRVLPPEPTTPPTPRRPRCESWPPGASAMS